MRLLRGSMRAAAKAPTTSMLPIFKTGQCQPKPRNDDGSDDTKDTDGQAERGRERKRNAADDKDARGYDPDRWLHLVGGWQAEGALRNRQGSHRRGLKPQAEIPGDSGQGL